jgi:hypothetical protein
MSLLRDNKEEIKFSEDNLGYVREPSFRDALLDTHELIEDANRHKTSGSFYPSFRLGFREYCLCGTNKEQIVIKPKYNYNPDGSFYMDAPIKKTFTSAIKAFEYLTKHLTSK